MAPPLALRGSLHADGLERGSAGGSAVGSESAASAAALALDSSPLVPLVPLAPLQSAQLEQRQPRGYRGDGGGVDDGGWRSGCGEVVLAVWPRLGERKGQRNKHAPGCGALVAEPTVPVLEDAHACSAEVRCRCGLAQLADSSPLQRLGAP